MENVIFQRGRKKEVSRNPVTFLIQRVSFDGLLVTIYDNLTEEI